VVLLHHLRVRTFVCDHLKNRKEENFLQKMIFSDEQSWPITLDFNIKNDVIIVPKGMRSKTNLHHRSKGDSKAAFSLHWDICYDGVLYFILYEGGMDMKRYEDFVKELSPKIEEKKLEFSVYVHDHVSCSRQKFPEETMNKVFGEGKWLRHPPPICRVGTGKFNHINFVWSKGKNKGKRCEYKREIEVPADVCECELESGIYADLAADMNICENAQGVLRKKVNELVKEGVCEYRGSVQKKMAVVRQAIVNLDSDKDFWHKLFGTLRKRYTWISENNGIKYNA